MVTGLTEEAVRLVTNDIHIPVLMGTFDGYTSIPEVVLLVVSCKFILLHSHFHFYHWMRTPSPIITCMHYQ